MGPRILAVIVALIVANAVFLIGLMIGTMFAPFSPENLEYMSAGERASYFGSLPFGAYATEIIAYVLGSLAAGWIVARITKDRHSLTLPAIVGVVLTLGGLAMFFSTIPGQPAWVIVISLLIFLPFTLLGQRLAR